ncbi:DUF6998 domain-containing protein [Paracoccus spongiarum]|uniref:DUF6998 domain-containing protein n=1 Tax=Paracoccus spongiarum TaxID=3064387 RepID=A0ABT9JGV3_9RHOB|nr:hypothetical protein [Paracoccus sp. 2205BS29-5]MDP5309043.1 hypothetical protein [Paracoccus sp. 2205BS29-5]
MSLSQIQIIRSLGEALQWLERELSWGTPLGELNHLTGRIGELYAAMITRGQMAGAVNQQGYDVVSADGERIQVKTITSSGHVSFRKSTIGQADRVMILKLELDEDEPSIIELLDAPIADLIPRLRDSGTKLSYNISRRSGPAPDLSRLKRVSVALWRDIRVAQLENGSILVEREDLPVAPAKPVLREIARDIGVDILSGSGRPKNTRALGSDIIKALG